MRKLAVAWVMVGTYALSSTAGAQNVAVRTLSSRPDAVSGGDVLVQVEAPNHSNWTVQLNGRDVTQAFHPAKGSDKPLALLSGLKPEKNTVTIRVNGRTVSKLELIDHPLAGPIFSGPHQTPFICQTEASGLGPAMDSNCSAKTLVQYYYKSTQPVLPEAPKDKWAAGFKTYDPAGPIPADVAQTTTSDGRTVNYIVRREIGVINRSIYEIRFLHQPGEPLPTPWTGPTPGWNGRLLYALGAGAAAGYHQGILGPVGGSTALGLGYAVATSTLNVFGNTSNARISAETLSMVKEHFIEQFGEPIHTIGQGGSGGAMQGQLIAQNYPGLLDGILIGGSFPDMASVVHLATDCLSLDHIFKTSPLPWTLAQKTAVSGFATWRACAMWMTERFVGATQCDASIPKGMIYDRIGNPKGARGDIYNNEINFFGVNPRTGLAYRPLDNVGVQYGLVAFNSGKIDAEHFVDLNERIGGHDEDGNIIATRMAADTEGLRLAYERGLVLTGGGGLSEIPLIDSSGYSDDLADEHDHVESLITRARLIAANGHADNQVILVNPRPELLPLLVPALKDAYLAHLAERDSGLLRQMDRWLVNIAADPAAGTRAAKVARSKPQDLADGCLAVDGERIVEPATYNGPGRCNRMYPPHGHPLIAAGAPVASDILKCALKPIDHTDYDRPLSAQQLARLKSVFSTGVCDYSRPGVGQQITRAVWQKYEKSNAAANSAAHGNELLSVTERLKDPRPIVVAHRTCWQFGPEESLKAIKACIDLGLDAVEGDLRTTKDGVVVLFHDETLDRMTNASGPLKNYTYSELKNVRLRDGAGGKDAPLTDQRIPTLEDVLIVAKSRLLVVLDVTKEPNHDQVFDVVAANGAEDRVIFVMDGAAASAKLLNARFLGKSAYVPVIWQCGWKGRQEDCYKSFSEVVADYQKLNPVDYVAFANAEFGAPGAGGGQGEAGWSKALAEGARFLGTDHPVELLKYLKSKGLR